MLPEGRKLNLNYTLTHDGNYVDVYLTSNTYYSMDLDPLHVHHLRLRSLIQSGLLHLFILVLRVQYALHELLFFFVQASFALLFTMVNTLTGYRLLYLLLSCYS